MSDNMKCVRPNELRWLCCGVGTTVRRSWSSISYGLKFGWGIGLRLRLRVERSDGSLFDEAVCGANVPGEMGLGN